MNTAETPVTSQPLVKQILTLHLCRLVKQVGPGCIVVAFFFNEADPIDHIEAEVAALSPADFAINEEVLKRTKADPRTLLPKESHDHLDLCTPYRKKPRTDRKFEINLKPETNIHMDIGYSPFRHMSDPELREVKHVLDEHREEGNISPSSSPVASAISFARKPNQRLRFCIDYHRLNAVTENDRYPLPHIDEVLRMLQSGLVQASFLETIPLQPRPQGSFVASCYLTCRCLGSFLPLTWICHGKDL